MKKIVLFAGLALFAVAACNKTPNVDPKPVDFSQYAVRVEPVITRATETNFEKGDQIGLSIVRAAGDYAANAQLTYDGTAFSGDLKWYDEGAEESTLKAYYPYQEGEALPTRFAVQADQSQGTAASDFVSAVKEKVLPSANAVSMVFKHQLSRLVVTVKNNSGAAIEAVRFQEIIPVANIGADLTAKVDENAKWQTITAFADGDKYYAIVPGQKVAPVVIVTAGGKELSQQLAEATLEPGKQYSVSIVVNKEEIKVVLAGEIENWADGGEITDGSPAFEEKLEDGYFTYDGVKYKVVKMKDGKWWMAQNLAYLPEGYTPATDLTAVTAGVFAPIRINEAHTSAEFTTDAAVIASNGYLYQAEVALGLKVGDLKSEDEAKALEGAQGICPKGWHVPTVTDIVNLVGKSVGATTNTEAPYYDGANGSLVKLNADGFNMDAFGAISIQDNTKTSGSFMGWASGYPDKLSSGMFCGSSFAGVTYNTSGDATSGVKNLQFTGFMPMTNKATEAEYTCNGTKVSYRIAAPIRCVRN
ncbi:MAG: fimbrillin family protein [Bacteroidales bacterium]|nr:fimbrillin family protein [Bacteroidales bacterium]